MNENMHLVPKDSLYHYGVKGMKWGVRRYQNKDGTLTPKGEKRLAKTEAYRQKLATKAGKRSKRFTYEAEQNRRNVSDLKKYGTESNAYKQRKKEMDELREYEYERDHKIKDDQGNEYVKKYSTSGQRFVNDIIDSMSADKTVRALIYENEVESRENVDFAKRWAKTQKNLMNMKVDVNTKKRDIRREYWR